MSKLEKLKAALPEEVGGIFITNTRNQRWVSGFNFEDGYVLVTKNESYLLTDSRYIEAAENEVTAEIMPMLMKGSRKELLQSLCKENGVSKLYFEDKWLSYADYMRFKDTFGDIELVPAGALIEDIREYKDPDEVAKIIEAQARAEKALEHILKVITPEMTEIEVALELDFYMRKLGAEGNSFPTIAVSGSASSLPHGVPRDKKLERGFLTMDFGCVYDGYCSDMTRTVVIGKADDEQKRLYNTVLSAQLAAEEGMFEGITGEELDKLARDVIDGSEFKGYFTHSLGHGVGMYIHEAPSASPSAKKPLTKGHVVTIEPGIYIAGKYGCRIEDMVYFDENGPRVITNCPKELIEIY